jgi:hypothetical protein
MSFVLAMILKNMTFVYTQLVLRAISLSYRRGHAATSPTHVLSGLAYFIPVVSSLSTVLKNCITSRVLYTLNRGKDQYARENVMLLLTKRRNRYHCISASYSSTDAIPTPTIRQPLWEWGLTAAVRVPKLTWGFSLKRMILLIVTVIYCMLNPSPKQR